MSIKPRLIIYGLILSLLAVIIFSLGYNRIIGSGVKVNENMSVTEIDEINKTIVTNLKIKEYTTSKNREIDNEIQKALKDKSNNFENPLVIQDPFDIAPLTAIAVFNTEKEVAVRMTVVGDRPADTFKYEFPKTTEHRIPIIGLYPDRENTIILEQMEGGQVKEKKELKIKTEPLPKNFENIVEVINSQGDTVEGITIVSGGDFKNPYAFDSSGKVRWYLKVQTEGHGYFPMVNGRFIVMTANSMITTKSRKYTDSLYDMDFLGRLHNVYFIPKGAHHEVVEKTPNDNLLVLSNSLEDHVEDLVVEIDRKTGKVVKELKLGNVIKDTYDGTIDWAHINSISYNNEDDSVILSVRDLSSAVKINWTTNELKWILSDPRIWEGTEYEEYVLKPVGPTLWHYEQHTVYEHMEDLDSNSETLDIMMFDNRVIRNSLIDEKIEEDDSRSSVTQYSIDEKSGTVTQMKRFPNTLAYITSNYQLFYDEDRLIANHASIRSGNVFSGEIYEYKYSTGEMLRSYKTRYGFYRAYRQDFAFESTRKPMDDFRYDVKGELTLLVKEGTSAAKPILKAPNTLDMWIYEGALYINMPDISISKVEFVSDEGTWIRKLSLKDSEIKMGSLPYMNFDYNLAIPLKELPKGKYSINVEYFGLRLSTGAQIEIK